MFTAPLRIRTGCDMTFGLSQTRYSHDEDGVVHDNLVEYCIDFLCGHMDLPAFFPFALNRVFREYLIPSNWDREEDPYHVIRCIVTEHGVVFDHAHNFVEDYWIGQLSSRFSYRITEDEEYYVEWTERLNKEPHIYSSGPVPLVGDDLQDMTFVLACLLLCRDIATTRLTSRYRNNHKVATNGKDKASV